jgi:hypothetical protein
MTIRCLTRVLLKSALWLVGAFLEGTTWISVLCLSFYWALDLGPDIVLFLIASTVARRHRLTADRALPKLQLVFTISH